MCDSPRTSTSAVHGTVYRKWAALGGIRGRLGYPRRDSTNGRDGRGRGQVFVGGQVWARSGKPAFAVTGRVLARWLADGAETGRWGYPTGDVRVLADGTQRGHLREGHHHGQAVLTTRRRRRSADAVGGVDPHGDRLALLAGAADRPHRDQGGAELGALGQRRAQQHLQPVVGADGRRAPRVPAPGLSGSGPRRSMSAGRSLRSRASCSACRLPTSWAIRTVGGNDSSTRSASSRAANQAGSQRTSASTTGSVACVGAPASTTTARRRCRRA